MNAFWITLLSIVGGTGVVAIERWNQKRLAHLQRQQIRYLRILPHANTTVDGVKVLRMVDQFAGYKRTEAERLKKGLEWFRFLVHKDVEGKLSFYLGFTEDRTTGVMRTWATLYPDSELHPVPHTEVPLPKGTDGYGGYFVVREKGERAGLPLRSFDARNDDWPDVLYSLDAGEKGTEVWLDLSFSPASIRDLKRTVERAKKAILPAQNEPGGRGRSGVTKFAREVAQEFDPRQAGRPFRREERVPSIRKTDLGTDEQERLRSLRRRYTGRESAFHVSLSLYVEGTQNAAVAQTAATTLASVLDHDNGVRFVRSRKTRIGEIAPLPSRRRWMLWTGEELANLLHLPDGSHRIYRYIPRLAKGQRSLKKGELEQGIGIGTLSHPLFPGRKVAIPLEQFTKHFVLTGITGSGKSSTAIEIFQSVLDQWIADPNGSPGFSYFDPARETVATILTRLLKAEQDGAKIPWEKVHYAYLGPTEYPLGLNLLHHEQGEAIDAVAKEVLGLLKYAYAGDTPRMDRLVENALLTLLEDRRTHTILGIVPILTDEDFRNRILPHVRDPIVRQFWEREVQDAALDPILNRLSPLLTNRTMRRMFGQQKWSLDIRKYMDEGHIFLWDLLNVSQENVKLTVGHIMTQYYQAAKTRSSGAKPHILAVDEAHLVQLPVMAKIIAETRKFGLCLGPITQNIGQFQDWLVEAIRENVGTILTCTQGVGSAGTVSAMTAGAFTKEYLQTLPERVVAVYTKSKNEEGRSEVTTFTVESEPPYMYMPNGQIADYRNESEVKAAIDWALKKGKELQKRDGTFYKQVDAEIEGYLGGEQTLLQGEDSVSSTMRPTEWEV